jgi:8-oxo-dGTP pyrophosphatase MutT (NUDIX family)
MKKKVRAVIIQNNSVLLIHRIKKTREHYVFPGGSVEDSDENDLLALVRECKEELGVDILVQNLITSNSFGEAKEQQEELFYSCKIIGGKLGTGEGPEFQKESGYEGMHTLCWVATKDFYGKDIQPREVATIILEMMRC